MDNYIPSKGGVLYIECWIVPGQLLGLGVELKPFCVGRLYDSE